jgi:hypothetical protein
VNVAWRKEQPFELQLQKAAAEYRKLYAEKQKVEKRLAKLHHRLSEKRAKPLSSSEQSEASSSVTRGQPVTVEQGCPSQGAESHSSSKNDRYVINNVFTKSQIIDIKGKGKAVPVYTMKTNGEWGYNCIHS